jgi:hypothetical protein
VTRVATGTLLTCLVLAVGACHGRPARQPPPPTTSGTPAMLMLTADQPTARISQPRRPGASAVRLDVRAVRNPSGQGLTINIAVEAAGSVTRRADIGNVSPYPASQPGVFTLVLPGAAADLVRQGPTMLVVTITTAVPGRVLEPAIGLNLTATLSP